MGNISLEQAASIIGEENVQKLIDAFPGGQIYLMSKIASSKPCKQPAEFKPWDYSKCNYILRKED